MPYSTGIQLIAIVSPALFSLNIFFTQSTVNRIVNTVQNLQSVVGDNLVANEGPTDIETETLSLQVEKKTAKALGNTGNKLKGCGVKPPTGDGFGLGESK